MQLSPDIFTPGVVVKRYDVGSWSGGRYTPGAETSATINAAVQPAGLREVMKLEEGSRTKDAISIWTPSPLYTLDEKAGKRADRVSWRGEWWEVQKVEFFSMTPELTHYHAIAVREQAK